MRPFTSKMMIKHSIKNYNFVGPPGIEPGLYAPHAYVLPVYYGPFSYNRLNKIPYFRLIFNREGYFPGQKG